jgi:hypothetical protein
MREAVFSLLVFFLSVESYLLVCVRLRVNGIFPFDDENPQSVALSTLKVSCGTK